MKKVLSIILCMSLCIMSVIPVSAEEVSKEHFMEVEGNNISTYASNYFNKQAIQLSSVAGSESKRISISTGSVSSSSQITSMSLNVRVNGGSDPFKLFVQAPDGTLYCVVMEATGVIDVDNFNGKNLSGSWTIWIETLGTVSLATVSVRINYSY